MLIPLLQKFSMAMEKSGYSHSQDFAHPAQPAPYGIVRRFYKNDESSYPIVQIGTGIFATNESTQYEWRTFKAQVLRYVAVLIDSYPTDFGFSLRPNYLELRYVDVFDKAVLGSSELLRFAETGTSLKVELPPVLGDKRLFWGEASGRFLFQRNLRDTKDSLFIMELASGAKQDTKESVIQLISKVVTTNRGIPALKNRQGFVSDVSDWLEFAHDITSPFFRDFVRPDVLKKFGRPKQ